MIRRLVVPLVLGAYLFTGLLSASPALAGTPEWELTVTPNADFFISGQKLGVYKVEAENVGTAPTAGEVKLEDVVPSGLIAKDVKFFYKAPTAPYESLERLLSDVDFSEFLCPSNIECNFPGALGEYGLTEVKPGQRLIMFVLVEVPANVEGTLEDVARISGGGAADEESSATNAANPDPGLGTLHFNVSVTNAAGQPYTQAGGHPFLYRTEFKVGTFSNLTSTGGTSWPFSGTAPVPDPRDLTVDLPPGLIANPQGVPRCPLADYFSQECETNKVAVGSAGIQLLGYSEGAFRIISPVFNLEPSGEYPGQLGIIIANIPLVMITSGVRTGSDYGVTASSLTAQAGVYRVRLNLWGVPADEGHNGARGYECQFGSTQQLDMESAAEMERRCEGEGGDRPAEVPSTPFLTMPTECSGDPLTIVGRYDTWGQGGLFVQRGVDLPAVDGCNNLSFLPRIESRPTTNLADAPSGLEFNLHVPQNEDPEGVATPELKEAVVKLPRGLRINPASGAGLAGCSEAQVGLDLEGPSSCPDRSKLGEVEVHSALLNEELTGAMYLATPRENPFGSLLAGYIVVEGQGIRIKLAGEFETDPQTGQITARFTENPQLPFEDLKLHIFGGARGALRTPAVCGSL